MWFSFSSLSVFLVAIATVASQQQQPNLFEHFINWARAYEVKLGDSLRTDRLFRTWLDNHKFIESFNANPNKTFTLGHNQFSAMTTDEFKQYLWSNQEQDHTRRNLRGYTVTVQMTFTDSEEVNVNNASTQSHDDDASMVSLDIPTEVDWVAKGAVTPVKDQGQCGSCWSFSTTGALEGAFFVKNQRLESFSEQQLVDCDNLKNGGKDHGCNGGLMDNAFDWIHKNGGLCTEQSYPYVSGQTMKAGTCTTTCKLVSGSIVQNHVDVTAKSDQAMMEALAKQPVSVAIEADQKEFQLYKSGVFTAACGTNLDHGVLVVGYGTDTTSGLNFYKVKNSWGTTWGQNGYILLARGASYNNGAGQCGVLMEASYPVL